MVCLSVDLLLFIFQNPGYMKDGFFIKIETMHYADKGKVDNVSIV